MNIHDIAKATRAARIHTGNAKIGTRVEQGRMQIVAVDYRKNGVPEVTELSGWMPVVDIVKALEAL